MLCSSAWLESHHKSGHSQKVIYPNGRIVYEPVQPKPAPKPAPKPVAPPQRVIDAPRAPEPSPSPSLSPQPSNPPLPCDGCGGGSNPPNPNGQCGKDNPVRIITSGGPGCEKPEKCDPKENPQVGQLDETKGPPVKFYKHCVEFKAPADIPWIVKHERENYLFGTVTYGQECCKYSVCVVTQCCCIETRDCELHQKTVAMRACRRNSDNTIDVYVLNEPGFPVQWVLHLGLDDATFQSKFPGQALP
jgi:hypothetical protein